MSKSPLAAGAAALCMTFVPAAFPQAAATPQVEIKGHRFDVEIAAEPRAWARGLMFREHLLPGHGMLFVFPDSEPRAFWMKNTKIPLDMLFFDANRKLVSVQREVPPCEADPCPTYPSGGPARYVLEVNGGASDFLEPEPGDELQILP
jgi:uncharacterized membrane protein (UPF0127 family)